MLSHILRNLAKYKSNKMPFIYKSKEGVFLSFWRINGKS